MSKPSSGAKVHDASDGDEWVEAKDDGNEGGRVVEAALNGVHATNYSHHVRFFLSYNSGHL